MRVLVCGGRDFHDYALAVRVLDSIQPVTEVIEGGANGADALGRLWAAERCLPVRTFRADWDKHGRAAGPLRNQQMRDEGKPDLVLAFPGGRGTTDMVRRAIAAGVTVRPVTQ